MRRLNADDLFAFKLAGDVRLCPGKNLAVYVESQANRKDNTYHTRIMKVWPGESPDPLYPRARRHPSPFFPRRPMAGIPIQTQWPQTNLGDVHARGGGAPTKPDRRRN